MGTDKRQPADVGLSAECSGLGQFYGQFWPLFSQQVLPVLAANALGMGSSGWFGVVRHSIGALMHLAVVIQTLNG